MDYLPVKCIHFTSVKIKKRKFDDTIENSSSNSLSDSCKGTSKLIASHEPVS